MINFFLERTLVGGHRGSPEKAKENTLPSFEAAIADKIDFIEFDIRKSKDGELIIHHDKDISGFELNKLSFSQINEISSTYGYNVPTLDNLLKLCEGRIMLDAEIKEPDVTEGSIRKILRYFSPDTFIVTSFYDSVLSKIEHDYKGIKKGLLFDKTSNRNLKERIEKLNPDFLLPHFSIFNSDVAKLCKEFNKKVILWTVNDKKDMQKFFNNSLVAGIISNFPDVASKFFNKNAFSEITKLKICKK